MVSSAPRDPAIPPGTPVSHAPVPWLLPAVFLSALLLPGLLAPVTAETRVQTELDTLAGLVWTGREVGLAGVTRGTVDFRSTGDGNIQSRLQLRLTLMETEPTRDVSATGTDTTDTPTLVEVPRASVRFRLPLGEDYMMRVTAGRDRLSWGLGALFNAADPIFGNDGRAAADLTQAGDVRDETAWLFSLYFPLGELGYLETVTLPPLANGDEERGAIPAAPASHSRTGLRVHSAAGPLTVEPSWLYDGGEEEHHIGFALQGNLGADLYGAAALHIPHDDPAGRITVLSTGAFYLVRVGRDHTLSFRLESLLLPDAAWSNRHQRDARYALLLYPEIVWSAGRSVQVIGRGIVSPLDSSGLITTGVSWNIFQGFHALAFASVQAGDDTSLYGWDRPGSVAFTTGFRYRF